MKHGLDEDSLANNLPMLCCSVYRVQNSRNRWLNSKSEKAYLSNYLNFAKAVLDVSNLSGLFVMVQLDLFANCYSIKAKFVLLYSMTLLSCLSSHICGIN
jgi:hypothetical protein